MLKNPEQLHTMRVASRLLALVCLLSAGILAEVIDAQYRAEVEHWRQQREPRLTDDDGWLIVTGLFWLRPGSNTAGSDPSNDILLPESAPAHFGTFEVKAGHAVFRAGDPSVLLNGKAVEKANVHPSGSDVLSSGPLQLLLLRRGDRLGVRLKDKNSQLRKAFTHVNRYPVQEDWKVKARFIPAEYPRFVVTSLKTEEWAAQALYEELYCARGEMENRIQEQFSVLADRVSSATIRANQMRMCFSTMAYVLVCGLRRLG